MTGLAGLKWDYAPEIKDELSLSGWDIGNPDSSSVTYQNEVIPKLDYLPFGELGSDKRYSGSWEAPYTFSGKERDSETGFSYFGARYYDSDMNIWLSVDPMLNALPYLSPYVYCS